MDEFGPSCPEVYRLDLLGHNEASKTSRPWDWYVKGYLSMGIGEGADYRQARMPIKQGLAYDKGRASPLLFMARLRVKGKGDKIPLSRDIYHKTSLPTGSPQSYSSIEISGISRISSSNL